MNIKDANKFIETISYPYKEPVFEFRSLSAKGAKPMHLGNSKNLDVKTLIELCSKKEYNMYMCINPLVDTKTRYAKDSDVKGFKWAYIDCDSPESVRNLFEHPLHKKAFITCTGTKPDARYHAYWLIQDDLNADQWKSVQKMLIDIFKSDNAIHNPSRIMRLIGSVSYPSDRKVLKGYIKETTSIYQEYPGSKISLEDIERYLQPTSTISQQSLKQAGIPSQASNNVVSVTNASWARKQFYTIDDVWSFLQHYKPETYNDWLTLGMSLHEEFEGSRSGLDLWIEHSALCGYKTEADVKESQVKWNSFVSGKDTGITGATLRWIERQVCDVTTSSSKVIQESRNTAVIAGGQQHRGTQTLSTQNIQTGGLNTGSVLMIEDVKRYFKCHVYVRDIKKIMTPNGDFLDKEQFKDLHGGIEFQYTEYPKIKNTDDAWKAFNYNQKYKFPKVKGTIFDANKPFQAIIESRGELYVNIYKPVNPDCVEGDVDLFESLLSRMLPDERDVLILKSWMASCVQNPGAKFSWAPVVIGTKGNGKSTLINVLQYCIDGIIPKVNEHEAKYTLSLRADDIGDKFNSDFKDKILLVVHEMHSEGLPFKDQVKHVDNLKSLITEGGMPIQAKYGDRHNERNIMNAFFCSNHMDAVRVDDDERRFSVFLCEQRSRAHLIRDGLDEKFFIKLHTWLRNEGYAAVFHHLLHFDIPKELDPARDAIRAPRTTTQEEAQIESMSPIEKLIKAAIDEGAPGFANGWVSSTAVRQLMEDHNEKRPSGNALRRILKKFGYYGGFRSSIRVPESYDNTRPVLYASEEMKGVSPDGKGWGEAYQDSAQGWS